MAKTFKMSDLTMWWDRELWFPFVEDEDANITGPGHMDKAAFAALVNQFERGASGADYELDDDWTEDDIAHRWVLPPEKYGPFITEGVTAETPGAIPVTTLWGVR